MTGRAVCAALLMALAAKPAAAQDPVQDAAEQIEAFIDALTGRPTAPEPAHTDPVRNLGEPLPSAAPAFPNYPLTHLSQEPDTDDTKAEWLVSGMSVDSVGINASFNGSEILVYGAVARETPLPPGPPLDIIVTVEGPSEPVTIRRKDRVLGIWINTESVPVAAAPGFYAVATSGPLEDILLAEEDVRYRISVPLVMRALGDVRDIEDTLPFTEALIRLNMADGRYRLDEDSVQVAEQTLFRADVALPTQLVEGDYKARVFLLREGRVIDSQRSAITVRKVGLERWLYRLALDRPFQYGVLSLVLAVAAGWGASAAFAALRPQLGQRGGGRPPAPVKPVPVKPVQR